MTGRTPEPLSPGEPTQPPPSPSHGPAPNPAEAATVPSQVNEPPQGDQYTHRVVSPVIRPIRAALGMTEAAVH
jgi:hypothetical protein